MVERIRRWRRDWHIGRARYHGHRAKRLHDQILVERARHEGDAQ